MQARRDLDLAPESLGAKGRAKVLVQDLYGNTPLVPDVAREEHGGHSSLTDLALHIVAITQALPQFLEKLGHSVRYPFVGSPTLQWCNVSRQRYGLCVGLPAGRELEPEYPVSMRTLEGLRVVQLEDRETEEVRARAHPRAEDRNSLCRSSRELEVRGVTSRPGETGIDERSDVDGKQRRPDQAKLVGAQQRYSELCARDHYAASDETLELGTRGRTRC